MNLETFKNQMLNAGSVGKATDGQFVGQCVSLINQYLSKVYGISAGAWGDAKDYAISPNMLTYFDRVGSPQAGDIGVSGAVPGNPYGHIWIYLSPTTILEQNGRTPLRVSTGNAYMNPIAILRRKGTSGGTTNVNPSAQQVKDCFTQFDFYEPNQDQINYYTQRDIRVLFQDLLFATKPTEQDVITAFKNQGMTASPQQIGYYTQYTSERMYKDLNSVIQTQGTVADQKKQIDDLIKKAQESGNTGGFTDADRVVAASTNSIVKQILDKITSIFK